MTPTKWTPERRALLRLVRTDGLGPVKLRRLLDVFGSAEAVLKGKRSQWRDVSGIGDAIADALADPAAESRIDDDIQQMERAGIRVLFEDDEEYADGLREIYDNPALLTIRGSIVPEDKVAVAIVGSRRCTSYGLKQAHRFAEALAARGVTIVSGLARGIDAAAHRGAMEAGGRTLAVLASGLGNIYPPEHGELAEEVIEHGAIMSEAPIDGAPLAGLFPLRNRIISGLSVAVIVIEAAERSGALSTANHAIDQNRDVFALPGRISDASSQGTNKLIQKGAYLVTRPEDILDQLGPIELTGSALSAAEGSTPPAMPNGLNEPQEQLWKAIGDEETYQDMLVETTGLQPSDVSSSLFLMELAGHIERLPGNAYRRKTR